MIRGILVKILKYFGRTYSDGKKITWKDGFSALRCIFYYNLLR